MKSMLRNFITTAAMVVAMLLSSNLEAQRSTVVVKRNGVTVLKTVRVTPKCETPKRHRATPRKPLHRRVHHRHIHHRGCNVRPPERIRDARHYNRVKHRRNHHAHRCTTCIRYKRWLNWKPCRYNPVIRVCR